MKTITANGVELLLVELPEDASEFSQHKHNLNYCLNDNSGRTVEIHEDFELLGTITNGVVDFDVTEFARPEYLGKPQFGSKNVFTVSDSDLKQSFLSLLAANGITGKKIVCLKISKA